MRRKPGMAFFFTTIASKEKGPIYLPPILAVKERELRPFPASQRLLEDSSRE
jgi:hypothetical protein